MLLCLAVTLATGHAASHRNLPREALEKYDDPPMYIFRLASSPQMLSRFGAFMSYQVNVDANGQNIVGDAANEPSITVDPTNHNKMAIGWRQFDTLSSNFRQAGWGYTTDGGVSWTFPGVLQPNVFQSDPVLLSDDTGRFFYLSLFENFFTNLWRSLNGGQFWGNLGLATGGDKQWFAIDNTGSVGHGFQYQAWSTAGNNYDGRQFSRSADGGLTWRDPVDIPNSPVWGTLDVNSDGDLFLAGLNFDTAQIWCERSISAKNVALTPTFEQSTAVNLGGQIGSGLVINPEGLAGQIFLAVDRSGTSSNNNVYLLASVISTGFTKTDVMFVRSTDSGVTFSPPRRVNDDPNDHSKWHWFGALAVAPNGRLDAVWLDTRNATNNTDSQLFYSYSTDAGVSWSANVAVSAPFDPFVGYPNQNKLGDYLTIVSDDTGGDVAYAATFNGEEDIYYVRVAPLASQLLNISTRALVQTGEQVLIGGFIITGNEPKTLVIRGVGPSLTGFGVSGALADPTLELHQGNTILATNDNWKTRADGNSQEAEVEATGLRLRTTWSRRLSPLSTRRYTAILAGANGGTGVGLVEVYDVSSENNSVLANISTRGFVSTLENVMIGGLIIGAGESGGSRVVMRAIGPSLADAGVQDVLPDPTLELHDGNGVLIASNDNWKVSDPTGQSQETEVRATMLAPANDLESAIVTSLAPGSYTAVVQGKNNGVGVGLIEAYDLPP